MPRKSFIFSNQDNDRLEKLQVMTRRDTMTSVVVLAVRVLWDLITAIIAGDTIIIQHKNGTKKEYNPLLDQGR